MSVDAKRLNTDAEFAAQYFSQFADVNAAQKALSEAGATEVNLFEITLTLAKGYQEKSGAGTPEGDKAILENKDTPASQREALERGMQLEEQGKEDAKKKAEEQKAEAEKKESASSSPAVSDEQKKQEDAKQQAIANSQQENKPATSDQTQHALGIKL